MPGSARTALRPQVTTLGESDPPRDDCENGEVNWPTVEPIETPRIVLEPLTIAHAAEMVHVLADPALYAFIGGCPPTLNQLQKRYRAQTTGQSADNTQAWLNWIVTLREPRHPVGYVQATVEHRADILEADIAWVISPTHQGCGLATEATAAMIGHLTASGVRRYVAHIHRNHAASAAVARRQGLRPSDIVDNGECRWQYP